MVMAIVAGLSAIAIPRYSGAVVRYRAEAAAKRVVIDLEYAAAYAHQTGQNISVEFKVGVEKIIIPSLPGYDQHAFYKTLFAQAPYKVDLLNVDFGGDRFVIFDGYGVPDSGGLVRVQAGTLIKTITLDADSAQATVQ